MMNTHPLSCENGALLAALDAKFSQLPGELAEYFANESAVKREVQGLPGGAPLLIRSQK
jgi:hypothetical protein